MAFLITERTGCKIVRESSTGMRFPIFNMAIFNFKKDSTPIEVNKD